MTDRRWTISHRIGRMRWDRAVVLVLLLLGLALAGRAWLQDNPGHNPWAPLDLRDAPGWATASKLAALRENPALCRQVLTRSAVSFSTLDPTGDGPCRREDRIVLGAFPLAPDRPPTSCAVAAALSFWLRQGIQPAARRILGREVARIEHLGSYSCRRLYGGEDGPWSEHATGNAIDIAAFILADGQRVSVLKDWPGDSEEALFLRSARDSACGSFGTVLSPDYNAAHADHLHLDQQGRSFGGVCR